MYRLVVISILVSFAVADGNKNDCSCKWKAPGVGGGAQVSLYGLVSAKVDVQSVRIFQLERKLQQVSEKLSLLRNRSSDALTKDLEQRLDKLEGTGCRKNQFACGGDTHECIHNALTCDGSADCANGADEDSKLCGVHVHVGSTWEGDAHWTACDVREGDSHYRITFVSSRRSKYFPTRDVTKAIMTTDVVRNGKPETINLKMTGYWSPGMRKIALSPPADYPLKVLLVCNPRYDYRSADCKVVRQATFEECATVTLTLVN